MADETTLNLILTDAGLAEVVNAENNGTAPVLLTEIALGEGRTATATQKALTSEFKRLTAVSGGNIGDNIIHISATDADYESYTAYEVGIFTSSGTLFAICAQSSPIIEKALKSNAIIAFDIVLSNVNPDYVTVGDTNFLLNSATTEKEGIIELATEAEAKAGTDTHRAVTPKVLDATIEGHDNIVHRSGAETIEGKKSFKSTIYKVSSQIDREITPSANIWDAAFVVYDKNSKTFFNLQAVQDTAGQNQVRMLVFDKEGSENQIISLGINSSGSPYATAPTPVAGDNSTKIATTAWVTTKAKEYLPLAGGIMTNQIAMKRNKDDSFIGLYGGASTDKNAAIELCGYLHSTYPGYFLLHAHDETKHIKLIGKPDGALSWNGKNIVRSVNNVNADAAGNVSITKVSSADKLATARTITLTGEVTGSTSFDGSGNVSITATVADNSHNHTIANVSGLQSALDDKAESSHTHDYLPLAGGKMTSTTAISRNVANSFLGLHGGTGTNNDGAQLFLCGASHSTMPGAFQLTARNSSKAMTLQGNLDGTLNWGDKYVLNNSFLMPVDTSAIMLTAGTSNTGGAYFRLYGKDNTAGAGQFVLATTNGTNTNALVGKPDGSLTWMGKDVLTEETGIVVVETWKSSDGLSWYRKWSDGWIEQGGVTELMYHGSSHQAYSFPTAFTQIPTLTTSFENTYGSLDELTFIVGRGGGSNDITTENRAITTTTFYGIVSRISGSSTDGGRLHWYACGF